MKQTIFNKNFLIVVIGQMVSLFGNAVLRFALPLYILDKTGSASIFGSILAISTIPTILFSPVGGILSDRMNKRTMMVILDLVGGITIILFSLMMNLGSVVFLITLLMIIFSIIQAIYQPVVQSSIPTIVGEDNLEKANGIVSMVTAMSNILGPLTAGMLYGQFGINPIMITCIVSFLLASLMECFIKIKVSPPEKENSLIKTIKADIHLSFQYIFRDNPVMFKVMLITSGMNLFLTAMILVGLPTMITIKLGLSSQLYGYTQGALAGGMIIGAILASLSGKRLNISHAYKMLGAASVALIPMGLAFTLNLNRMALYWIITTVCFFMMVVITIFTITIMSFIQRSTPEHLIGRVISYILAIPQFTLPVGQMMYGFLFNTGMGHIDVIIYGTAFFSILVAFYSRKIFNDFECRSKKISGLFS
jgi:MFS family permease